MIPDPSSAKPRRFRSFRFGFVKSSAPPVSGVSTSWPSKWFATAGDGPSRRTQGRPEAGRTGGKPSAAADQAGAHSSFHASLQSFVEVDEARRCRRRTPRRRLVATLQRYEPVRYAALFVMDPSRRFVRHKPMEEITQAVGNTAMELETRRAPFSPRQTTGLGDTATQRRKAKRALHCEVRCQPTLISTGWSCGPRPATTAADDAPA